MLRLAWLCLASLLLALLAVVGLDAYSAAHARMVELSALWSPDRSAHVVVSPAHSRRPEIHRGGVSGVRLWPWG